MHVQLTCLNAEKFFQLAFKLEICFSMHRSASVKCTTSTTIVIE